jgi:hypothetical protein
MVRIQSYENPAQVRDELVPLKPDSQKQDPCLLAKRFDPKMAIWGLFVLKVSATIRTHKDQFAQNLVVSVRIQDVTFVPTVTVRIIYWT